MGEEAGDAEMMDGAPSSGCTKICKARRRGKTKAGHKPPRPSHDLLVSDDMRGYEGIIRLLEYYPW